MRLRQKLSVALLALALFSISAPADVTSGDELYKQRREVGEKILCNCPSKCSATVATCPMFRCSFKEAANEEIETGLKAGVAPTAIVASLIAKFGADVGTLPDTSGFGLWGWMMPFITLGVGLAIVPFVVARWKRRQLDTGPKAGASRKADEATLARFQNRIDKETSDLD